MAMETKIAVSLPLFPIPKILISNELRQLLSNSPVMTYSLNNLMCKQSFVIVYTVSFPSPIVHLISSPDV